MKSGKVVLGVLAGIAIGAITGILLAPEKGSKTRKNIADKLDAYVDKLGSQFKGFVESVNEKFEALTHDANVMAENGTAKMSRSVDHLTDHKKG